MKRSLVVALGVSVLMLAGAVLSGCASDENGDSSGDVEPIRIGAVLSLSGSYSGLGTPERDAIVLEVERINGAGGINGRPIEVLIEDDATDEAKAQAAASKLLDQEGVVAIIGATGTGQSMAMRGDIERAGVAQVSMAGGNVITDQFSAWVFQTPWPNRLVVPFTLAHLQDSGISRLALISDAGGYGKDGVQVTRDSLADFDIEIVAEESFNRGDTDMSGQLTKIKAAGADAILVWSAGSEAATVLRNATDLGLGIPLFGAPGNARLELIEGAADAAEGFVFAAGHILVPESYGTDTDEYEVATDFIDRYTVAYGVGPDIFAGHAYDAFHIIVEALKRMPEGEIDPAALRDEIER
ncbi:MAG: ABC transporter substrate-binding protein, partial [Actinomycetota bacterium]|nr:ABC transporter substrate-binding protein [Actinomycetota bacterium]